MTLNNQELIERFISYILSVKRYSPLTARNYRHDLEEFLSWGFRNAGGQKRGSAPMDDEALG